VRIAVFIDWQNAYKAARTAFGLLQEPGRRGVFSPLALGRLLARFNRRGDEGELIRVEIHRGWPNPQGNPIGHGAVDRHREAWLAEDPDLVHVHLRPLKYNEEHERDEEKGIDVALACGVLEAVLTDFCDVAVIFSHDSDLLPPIETICRVRGPTAIETASWASDSYPYQIPPAKRPDGQRYGVINHTLRRELFDQVETPVNYARHR
jgi:uncharacterized LabA/DUF88 family protein